MHKAEKKIRDNRVAYGCNVTLAEPTVTEIMGNSGFDFFWFDMEHSHLTRHDMQYHLMAARACGDRPTSLVRIPDNDPIIVKALLDMGADGIIFPMIRSCEDVQKAVDSCFYPPRGFRGYSPKAATRYGLDDAQEYIHHGSLSVWKLIQIETVEAYRCLDKILENEDLTGIIVGPADLSGALGKLCHTEDPEVDRVITDIAKRTKAAGKILGTSVGGYDDKTVSRWLRKGFDLVAVGGDINFIRNGSLEAIRALTTAEKMPDRVK